MSLHSTKTEANYLKALLCKGLGNNELLDLIYLISCRDYHTYPVLQNKYLGFFLLILLFPFMLEWPRQVHEFQ